VVPPPYSTFRKRKQAPDQLNRQEAPSKGRFGILQSHGTSRIDPVIERWI
jgi:hypothetical protein